MRLFKAIIIGFVCIAMTGFSACSDDPAGTDGIDPYLDEGEELYPLDISMVLPYSGEVSIDGTSYYRISGEIPEASYTIKLIRVEGLTFLSVPDAGGTGSVSCGWENTTPGDTIECSMISTAGGVLDFSVLGDDIVGGIFEITISTGGEVNEGSWGDPVEITSFPFSGMALTSSCYVLTGLTPGGAYAIEFTEVSAPAKLTIFPDDTYGGNQPSCTHLSDSGAPCQVAADGNGHIYLLTRHTSQTLGFTYTISVTSTGLANEGSQNAPVDITTRLPYAGMVHMQSSWYIITGLTAGSPYTVTMSDATDQVTMYLYGPGWWESFRGADCQRPWPYGGGTSIDCVSLADINGDIRIEVRGYDTADGAAYDLEIAAGGIPNEGYFRNEIDVTGVMPWSGTVFNGPSSYKITGMAAATDYTITISDLTDNLNLYVYEDEARQNFLCNSYLLGSADETCVVQTTTGEFHFYVMASSGVYGATFTVNVTP